MRAHDPPLFSKRGSKCHACDSKLVRSKDWDEDMQMVVESESCPNGHNHGMAWRPATKRDIKELGLVKTK